MPRIVDANRDNWWAKEEKDADDAWEPEQPEPLPEPTFHNVDREDTWAKDYEDREREPAQPAPTRAREAALVIDEFDSDVHWQETSLQFAPHNLPADILAPDPEPEPRAPQYHFQGNPYGRYEAFRAPEDGEKGLKYIEDAKGEEAARRYEVERARWHDPNDDPEPTRPIYTGNPEFTVEIDSPTSRTIHVDYQPPAEESPSRRALNAEVQAAIRAMREEEPVPLEDLYPETDLQVTHRDNPAYLDLAYRDDLSPSEREKLEARGPFEGEALVVHQWEEIEIDPVVGSWDLFGTSVSTDPVAEVQEVFPGAEEASGSGGWNLLPGIGEATDESEGDEGDEGDDQDDGEGGGGEDNRGGGDGIVWSW